MSRCLPRREDVLGAGGRDQHSFFFDLTHLCLLPFITSRSVVILLIKRTSYQSRDHNIRLIILPQTPWETPAI